MIKVIKEPPLNLPVDLSEVLESELDTVYKKKEDSALLRPSARTLFYCKLSVIDILLCH